MIAVLLSVGVALPARCHGHTYGQVFYNQTTHV